MHKTVLKNPEKIFRTYNPLIKKKGRIFQILILRKNYVEGIGIILYVLIHSPSIGVRQLKLERVARVSQRTELDPCFPVTQEECYIPLKETVSKPKEGRTNLCWFQFLLGFFFLIYEASITL